MVNMVWADKEGNFKLSDGSQGNPGCECGEADAIVKMDGVYYCVDGVAELLEGENKIMETEIEKTWDTQELQEEFEVLGFMAPYVVVRRKSDGKKGSLQFDHYPRQYYGWLED